MPEVRIAAQQRTEFGKGPARRCRREGRVPAVLYGHGTQPRHLELPGHDLMLALKTPNVLLRLSGLRGDNLALPKEVQRDPIKGFLRHVDLLVVKRGEKVTVEVPLEVTGDLVPGGMLDQQLVQVPVDAEATHIPGSIEVNIGDLQVGDSITAGQLQLPDGVELATDSDALVVHVVPERTAEQVEAELAEAEAEAGVEREQPSEEVPVEPEPAEQPE